MNKLFITGLMSDCIDVHPDFAVRQNMLIPLGGIGLTQNSTYGKVTSVRSTRSGLQRVRFVVVEQITDPQNMVTGPVAFEIRRVISESHRYKNSQRARFVN